jgi:hypothetical protein
VIRYEGVRFSDGSVAIRRIDADPCERATLTFESVRECNEELGRVDVIEWVADLVAETGLRERQPWGRTAGGAAVHGVAAAEPAALPCPLRPPGKRGDPWKFHHPSCKKPDAHEGSCIDAPAGYEPTEETDEP